MTQPTSETPTGDPQLQLGPVAIFWDRSVEFPIAVNHHQLAGEFRFITVSWVVFVLGFLKVAVPCGFVFDGATIPRWLWFVPGFAPLGPHLWAALCHDWLCVLAAEHPDQMDRELADAVFGSLLSATGVGWRGVVMDLGVAAYRRFNQLKGALAA